MKTTTTILLTTTLLATGAIMVLAPAAPVLADTSAYWRHEEGTAGSIVPDGQDTVLDSSGAGNHMQTFDGTFQFFTAATYTSVVSPLPLRSGLPNTLSLDFGPSPDSGTEDGGGLNDDNYTTQKPIQTQLFTQQTVELSFNMHTIGGFQALFGKDGKPLGVPQGEPNDVLIPPFKVVIRGDGFPGAVPNQIFVEWIDGDGDIHSLSTGETTVADQWYHVAVTRTATDAELWVAGETGPYELVDALSGGDFAGDDGRIEIAEPLGYTIGRGAFNNNPADWSNAYIDEVRISDVALTQDQFLFVPVEDPGQPGDLDGDGDVDGNDFLVFQRGVPAFDQSDLDEITSNFGEGAAVASAGAVPEPSTALLTVVAMAGLGYGLRKSQANGAEEVNG